jgi:hypothetical protein
MFPIDILDRENVNTTSEKKAMTTMAETESKDHRREEVRNIEANENCSAAMVLGNIDRGLPRESSVGVKRKST